MDFSTEKVKEFIDRCHPYFYYEGYGNRDEEIVMYYRLALEDVRQYLESLLYKEVLEGGYTGAGVSLLLPLEDMNIHVGIETAEDIEGMNGKREPGIIYTPIGKIDMYIYKEIIKEDNNPVRMLYESMIWTLSLIRSALSLEPDGLTEEKGILTEDWLRRYDDFMVVDPLELFRFDLLWGYWGDFFKGIVPW